MGDLQSQGAAGCNSHCFSENSNRSRTDLFDDWSSLHSQFVTFSLSNIAYTPISGFEILIVPHERIMVSL